MKENIFDDLRESLDMFINKGFELSEGMNAEERDALIKEVMDEYVDKAMRMVEVSEPNSDKQELVRLKSKLQRFVSEYYKERVGNKKGKDRGTLEH